MKKVLILGILTVLSSTSLGQAVKFDPSMATPEEFAKQIGKNTSRLFQPQVSLQEKKGIREKIEALVELASAIASAKNHSKEDQAKSLDKIKRSYANFTRSKLKCIVLKYQPNQTDFPYYYPDFAIDEIEKLIKTQYGLSLEENSEFSFRRLEKENDNGKEEKEQKILTLSQIIKDTKINVDPLFILKLCQAESLKKIAQTKDDILAYSEAKVNKAFKFAEEYEKKEIIPTYQGLYQALKDVKDAKNQSYSAHSLITFLDRIQNPLKKEDENRPITAYPDCFIVNNGFVSVTLTETEYAQMNEQNDEKLFQEKFAKADKFPLVMYRVSDSDGVSQRGGRFAIKTATGVGNYTYMSEPIPSKNVARFCVFFEGRILEGGCGIGLLTTSEPQKWIFHKPYTKAKEIGGINDFIEIPSPQTEENVILTLTNNQPVDAPARSKFGINMLKLISLKKQEEEKK